MTSVWPALWPPWKRTTISACSDNQSTILPFPSSPHWAPTTTTLAITVSVPASDQTPGENYGRGRSDARQPNRIKDAGGGSKQERVSGAASGAGKLLISPRNPPGS